MPLAEASWRSRFGGWALVVMIACRIMPKRGNLAPARRTSSLNHRSASVNCLQEFPKLTVVPELPSNPHWHRGMMDPHAIGSRVPNDKEAPAPDSMTREHLVNLLLDKLLEVVADHPDAFNSAFRKPEPPPPVEEHPAVTSPG
jgi:hypothetical protein